MDLGNRYYALRHGESLANVAGRIVSNPVIGVSGYGLSPRGLRQVARPAKVVGQWPEGSWDLYASDFARTRETALRVMDLAGGGRVVYSTELRERDFGPLEGESTERYAEVWAADAAGADLPPGVEPAEQVLARTLQLVRRIEERFQGRRIVLVSHGDVLQILAAGLLGWKPTCHRRMPELEVAELRELVPRHSGKGDRSD